MSECAGRQISKVSRDGVCPTGAHAPVGQTPEPKEGLGQEGGACGSGFLGRYSADSAAVANTTWNGMQ